ncbi:succinyl-diaminopimelate desuccinylase [bacterium BMS3Bbin02]|nr:succinyl-diaminopimelate desuccinylase [bacterium BMS3Bbin02]
MNHYGEESSDAVVLLQELIRNRCVNTGEPESGNEWRSVATIQEFLGAAGTVIEPAPGRQSVVYRIAGSTPGAPALALLPHLDVVPANASGWSCDPFAGEIRDGFVWGRGAVDMLNMTACMAVVFKRYLDGDLPPLPGDLVFAAVADEEAGGKLGAAYLVDHEWSLVACDFLLTEVATPTFQRTGEVSLPVTVGEKGPGWRELHARGNPSHASQPFGADNALLIMADATLRLAMTPTPVGIDDGWTSFVDALGLPDDLTAALKDPDSVDAAIDELALTEPTLAKWAHACTHMTIAPTVMQAGTKANTIADVASASVDVRVLPGQSQDDVDAHLRKAMGELLADRIEIEPIVVGPATRSDTSGALWEAIGDACEQHIGTRSLVPMTIPVATDARFFRERGVTAYGVGWFDDGTEFSQMIGLFHGHDERVSVVSVNRSTAFLTSVLQHFGVRTAP